MAEEEECPHGLGDPSWCATCKKKDAPPPDIEFVGLFPAKYLGTCPLCLDTIWIGDLVKLRKVDGENRGVVHEECADNG